MCGIAVTFAYKDDAPPVDPGELIAVRDHMLRRGPDGCGAWFSPDGRLGLAHRRLSIIDLSEAGAQPMWNAERTLCITYNGEIYNYAALRRSLADKGYRFQSDCDTEVLLQLYAEKGADMMNDLRGMYAFAIWDARERTLFMARDPFGIKPLYYADDGRTVRIASQVKALLTCARIDREPEPAGHVGFFLWGAVPDPFTLYKNILGLPAGHSLTIRQGGTPQLRSFCSIPDILREAEATAAGGGGPSDSDGSAHTRLHAALRESAEAHLVADVPVGVFLSAGLDSSTIAALVSESHSDVRTVTLGFDQYRGSEQDETKIAELVAEHCGSNHRTISITRADFEQEAARLFDAMDRPSIDGVNTYFVSLAARRAGLKVALSGVGGDELFGGYASFADVPRMVRLFGPVSPVLPSFGREFRIVTAPVLKRFTSPKYAGVFEFGGSYPGAYLLRRSLFMPWELPNVLEPELVREGWQRLHTLTRLGEICEGIQSERLKVSSLEMCWYMRHQLLRDSDWAGMAHSLEIRVPLVDVKMLQQIAPLLASRTPPTKHDMAVSPERRLPLQVLRRPKTGFTVPVRDWLLQSFDPSSGQERGLRGWAREVYSRHADPVALHSIAMRRRPSRKFYPSKTSVSASHPEQNAPRLRVLSLVSDAFGGFGGISKFNRDFLTAVCASDRVESVTMLPRLMPHDPGELPAKLVLVRESLGGKKAFVRATIATARRFRSETTAGASTVILCGHINLLPAAMFARQICGGTVHLIVHGIEAWKPVRDPSVRMALRRLDGFITVSHVTKQRFERWTRLRFDQGMVLPNSVDLRAFEPGAKSPALLERYKIGDGKVLMTLGRLESAERYKGFDETIELLPTLAPDFPGLTYLVCGDGPDRLRLASKARQLGCKVRDIPAGDPVLEAAPTNGDANAARVIFTGRVSEEEKADHFRLADAYVMPSSGEGFGIVYLEALACGIPVIGSKSDGSREALREGKLGLLVDPQRPDEIESAIRHVLNANGSAAVRPSREAIEYFSTPRFQERVARIIEAIG